MDPALHFRHDVGEPDLDDFRQYAQFFLTRDRKIN